MLNPGFRKVFNVGIETKRKRLLRHTLAHGLVEWAAALSVKPGDHLQGLADTDFSGIVAAVWRMFFERK
jgi:hypothetical protein